MEEGPEDLKDARAVFVAASSAVAAQYDADVYFYSGPIDDNGFGQLTEHVAAGKQRDKALLIMVTNGGLANAAYQIARLLQREYKEFALFCPGPCKSAGTLVAIGAARLIMDGFSELGPLDVQLAKQNELISRKSGLLAKSSFDALAGAAFDLYERLMIGITLKSGGVVSFKLASELSATMAAAMLSPVYAQINPETVGSENRDLSIALEYGVRLAGYSKNTDLESVYRLVHDYPSHDFIIDNQEAVRLFKNVSEPDENLYKLVALLGDAAYSESAAAFVCALPQAGAEDHAQPSHQGDAESPHDAGTQALDGGGRPDWEGDSEPPDSGGSGDEPPAAPVRASVKRANGRSRQRRAH
jgi:hypothetical protein